MVTVPERCQRNIPEQEGREGSGAGVEGRKGVAQMQGGGHVGAGVGGSSFLMASVFQRNRKKSHQLTEKMGGNNGFGDLSEDLK